MRPKSTKNEIRDWYRNRRFRQTEWDFDRGQYKSDLNLPICSMRSFYNGKEARTNGNRAVRRFKGYISDGCAYKKIYDVQWEIW